EGRATIRLPETIDILRIWARVPEHVALFANWWPAERPAEKIPAEFTFHIERGTTIGGWVKNEDGQPIDGVQIEAMLEFPGGKEPEARVLPNTWLSLGPTAKKTEEHGHWVLQNVPVANELGVRLRLVHPDYVSDYTWGGLQKEQQITMQALREGTAVM